MHHPRFSPDVERFRAQLRHFCWSFGVSPKRMGLELGRDPMRAYAYIKGTRMPTYTTRKVWRAWMRRHRKSIKI
jgi:hypothetical protein